MDVFFLHVFERKMHRLRLATVFFQRGGNLAKKTKNKKLKKQIRDAFILALIICAGAVVLISVISLISSPTNTFIIKESKISSEESKVRICN